MRDKLFTAPARRGLVNNMQPMTKEEVETYMRLHERIETLARDISLIYNGNDRRIYGEGKLINVDPTDGVVLEGDGRDSYDSESTSDWFPIEMLWHPDVAGFVKARDTEAENNRRAWRERLEKEAAEKAEKHELEELARLLLKYPK